MGKKSHDATLQNLVKDAKAVGAQKEIAQHIIKIRSTTTQVFQEEHEAEFKELDAIMGVSTSEIVEKVDNEYGAAIQPFTHSRRVMAGPKRLMGHRW